MKIFYRFAVIFLILCNHQWDPVTCLTLSPKQQCILNDVSWKLKVRFLKKLAHKKSHRDVSIQALVMPDKRHLNFARRNDHDESLMWRRKNLQLVQELKRNVAIDFLTKDNPQAELKRDGSYASSLSIEENSDTNNDLNLEKAGVPIHDGLQTDFNDVKRRHLYRRQGVHLQPTAANQDMETEKDMKLKLFRLMYDTVKDNDNLVRKADAIKKEYEHSNFFEIGFVMGAITDKVNTMSDVALTVERLYDDWKPIEHVNAYEQIANQAIEINHLIDILQSAYKKTKAAPTAAKSRKHM
ncbi:uncharacterized protein LOC128682018 [Plodia interpunctella]|uniref:uncharacterized protein LOC128682018 n=1 Tax=Plodia interpunctella TaxID=58824 RepID=UPI002368E628|nr:uncharacterized protein LOC128682018 [Plodia interpunctella]